MQHQCHPHQQCLARTSPAAAKPLYGVANHPLQSLLQAMMLPQHTQVMESLPISSVGPGATPVLTVVRARTDHMHSEWSRHTHLSDAMSFLEPHLASSMACKHAACRALIVTVNHARDRKVPQHTHDNTHHACCCKRAVIQPNTHAHPPANALTIDGTPGIAWKSRGSSLSSQSLHRQLLPRWVPAPRSHTASCQPPQQDRRSRPLADRTHSSRSRKEVCAPTGTHAHGHISKY
jgi:hypothetical protein